MERSIWAWMPVAAWLVSLSEPVPCGAQPPSPASTGPAAVIRTTQSGIQPPTSLSSPPRLPTVRPGDSGVASDLPPALPNSPAARAAQGDTAGAMAPNPLATGLTLKPAPVESTDFRFPINLAAALRLSDARPLIVAAAQASVWVAEAELTRAKVLWVPTLNIGFDYVRHDGGGPDFNKGIMTAPSVNFFYGGAGLWGTLPLTDAIYAPLVTRQNLNARHWDVQTAKNDALM